MARRKTKEQFVLEVKSIFPNIELVGDYTNVNVKTQFKCLIHDFEFDAYPCNILAGHGCKKCGIEKNSKSRRKSHKQFAQEMMTINPNIELIGEYIDTKTKILVRCRVDGYEWLADPKKLRRGVKCAVCTNHKLMTGVNDVATTRPDLVKYFKNKDDARKYMSGSEKILTFICPEDGEEKTMTIAALTRFGLGCNACHERQYGRRRVPYRYWNEQTIQEYLSENYDGYTLLDTRVEKTSSGTALKVLIKCPNEKHDAYWAYWTNILSGYKCFLCVNEDSMSRGERMAEEILQNRKILFYPQKRFDDCRDVYTLPFDFYLPDYNLIVEIMGEQHEHPVEYFGGEEAFQKCIYHDKIKRDYLVSHSIPYIDIWYYEFDQMEDLILNKIQQILSTIQN